MFFIRREQITMKFRGKLRKVLQGSLFQCEDVKKYSGKGSENPEF